MAGILTDNQVQQYREQGYLLVERLFDEIELKLARQAIQEMLCELDPTSEAEVEPNDPTVFRRIWSPTERHKVFQEMAYNSKILDRVESLIGPNIVFHYSKINMKAAQVGSVVEWHQDLSYYPHTNTDLLSCLIYLDDATPENGCLQVIPGSHKYGILDHYIDGYFRGKLNAPSAVLNLSKATLCEAPAGSTLFLHCLTVHSSIRNRSNMPRRAFLPAYRAADAYPIYLGPHANYNESSTKLLRGQHSNAARMETGIWQLPIAQSSFNSLYEIQEGSHLNLD
ncbi:phytanoyl-CoA dioxygenase family protein [Coleofasciculus sp.]|uniref:phytanoyl-CoA dioxygenase family protein n=1 Tax=Coleofasciculus sp. TaxID=3100458 RepID=UPI003A268EAE